MIRSPSLFGISMVRRSNRRMLVLLTYAVLTLVMGLTFWFLIWRPSETVSIGFALVFNVVFNGISGFIFGELVQQSTVPQKPAPPVMGLGLIRNRRDPDDPDERDIRVRDTAYFVAFRIVAFYSILLFLLLPGLLLTRAHDFRGVVWGLTIPLLVMTLTLPQAIILWTEPDLPTEMAAAE